MANIAFFESMTPYWVDMQNALHDNNGYEVYYVYNSLYGYDSTPELCEKLHFTPHQMSGKRKNSLRIKELSRIIGDNNPDSIISIEFSLLTIQLLLIRFFSQYKFRIIVRCDDSYDMLQHPYSKAHALARALLGKCVDDIILCDSRTRDAFKEMYGKGLYFPIIREDSRFMADLSAAEPMSGALSAKYVLDGKKVILFVGRIDENKNISSLLKALSMIETDDMRLVVIGDGPEKENVVSESGILQKCQVIFTGMLSQKELIPWYSIADVLCLVSFKEAFGAVVNEALLSGVKCVVSNTAGSSHLIKDGVNGYVCDPRSIDDIAGKLHDALMLPSNSGKKYNLMPKPFNDYYEAIQYHI